MSKNLKLERGALKPIPTEASVCYLVGAGFSAATRFRFPTATGFLKHEFDDLTRDEPESVNLDAAAFAVQEALNRIEREYGALDGLNLEALMTDIYVRAFGIGRAWDPDTPGSVGIGPSGELQGLYEALQRCIYLRLSFTGGAFTPCPLAERLVQALRRQDSIATLNYDVILEAHLDAFLARHPAHTQAVGCEQRLERLAVLLGPHGSTVGGPAAPMFRELSFKRGGILAKLHGSVDWYSCPNEHCPNHRYIALAGPWYGRPLLAMRQAGCSHCGWHPRIVIIPPTVLKAFDEFPNLHLLWSQSYHALRRASRWVFMGVSLAPTDFHLAALLRSASRSALRFRGPDPSGQLCIVDKQPECVANRLVDALAPPLADMFCKHGAPIAIFETLPEYLDAVDRVDTERRDVPSSE